MTITKLGIRELVEFTLRSGDLNASMNSMNTALEGAQIHRMLQKSRGENYQKEYSLEREVQLAGNPYLVHGRADGVILNGNDTLIEEIKTSDVAFEDLTDNTLTLYWGQAKMYAYILMTDEDLNQLTLQLTYYRRTTEEVTTRKITYTLAKATEFFNSVIAEYETWLKLQADLRESRNASIKDLAFPFDHYRTGQRELAVSVYKALRLKKQLFIEAPTGTGKTISTVFPCIKAMGENQIQRLFYLTAKQSTRRVAEQALGLMAQQGLTLRSITLTAKDTITFPEEADLPPEENPFMVGYYDRLKPGLKDILTNETAITRETVEAYARKHQLDSFEFSLDISLFCDVIICDYNYLFDPQVYLQRFFAVDHDDDNFFLVDEAHNLVSRSRDMYSTELSLAPLTDLIATTKDSAEGTPALLRAFRAMRRAFFKVAGPLLESGEEESVFNSPADEFNKAVTKLSDHISDWLGDEQRPQTDYTKAVLDFYFACLSYLKIADFYDETYRTKITLGEDHDREIVFKQLCLDPSLFLRDCLDKGRGAVLFSATLSPLDYYQRVLGGNNDSLCYQLPSPFPPKHQSILITDYISTTYRSREANLAKIITGIKTLVNGKTGNYLVFLPSYSFLSTVSLAFKTAYPEVATVIQAPNMSESDRSDFLGAFQPNPDQSLVGFAILGGLFSEGIDLTADRLIGVAIVSVGLPGISTENNLLRDYFDSQGEPGFEYAYQIPGLNHVFQAAGRLIRSTSDEGVILLMDQRFASQRYTRYFPPHWQYHRILHSADELAPTIEQFWQMTDKEPNVS
ncbi:ATP-dependent DNA helicase [Lactobacillus sp. LC28-10]|uniref:ATP-dependent DNA helicase n=1 Tax=Secundilactobacillus angelensis TaxID=2722706 RepID=A0ABX1L1G9_9LACO|nr:ATP-dependent DNA helicase [Secundilactobacillus angelensis]MCH5462362.1 ATP-dependent DNA helicase [Secundilactobacillus angelensis]NLR18156.1 ATP-dependent DNA helicase [Secundilactobacillus angelensis]